MFISVCVCWFAVTKDVRRGLKIWMRIYKGKSKRTRVSDFSVFDNSSRFLLKTVMNIAKWLAKFLSRRLRQCISGRSTVLSRKQKWSVRVFSAFWNRYRWVTNNGKKRRQIRKFSLYFSSSNDIFRVKNINTYYFKRYF